jgi:outer membrane murein-binding lipoprotein Lpp
MKRSFVILAAAMLVAVVAIQPAVAAAPSLATQVKTLQKQVKKLQKQVKTLRKDVNFVTSETATNYAGDACQTALIADLFQATWTSPTQLDDRTSCQYIGVVRVAGQVFTALASYVKWAETGQARLR